MVALVLPPAEPAPLILTAKTGHVVATIDLLKSCFALRAISEVAVSARPSVVSFVYIILAFAPSVPLLPTLEAHLQTALTSNELPLLWLSHVISAVRARAPPQIWVGVNIYVLFEL